MVKSGYTRKGYKKYKKAGATSTLKTASKFLSAGEQALVLARSAVKSIQYIKGLVNSEVYKYDQNSNPDTALNATSGYQVSFCTIAQGDTDAGRTGNSILVKGIRFSILCQNASSSPVPFTRVRVMVFKDKQEVSDLAYPTLSDVLENTGEYACTSALNSNTVGRWTKLYDKVKIHDIVNRTSSIFEQYIRINTHVRYNGTASSDIQKNNIWLVVLCDNTNVAYNNPTIHTYQMRTYYHDN